MSVFNIETISRVLSRRAPKNLERVKSCTEPHDHTETWQLCIPSRATTWEAQWNRRVLRGLLRRRIKQLVTRIKPAVFWYPLWARTVEEVRRGRWRGCYRHREDWDRMTIWYNIDQRNPPMLRRTNDRERERKMEAFDKDLFVEMLCKDSRATVVSAECDPFKLKKMEPSTKRQPVYWWNETVKKTPRQLSQYGRRS